MHGQFTTAIPEQDDHPYQKKTAREYSNRQLKARLCSWYTHGCEKCEVYEECEYGREWVRRMGPTAPKKKKPATV